MSNNKRIIEVAFPVEEVSGRGAREISGLHTWWARRPLGPSRATAYAALVDNQLASQATKFSKNTDKFLNLPKQVFIAALAEWKNTLKLLWINQAKQDILESHDGKPPKVLDPFGGGGSIPLEAQRLGCETHSCDLNPVAVLIQKCTLEYPQNYGPRLYDDVKKWGEQILSQMKVELKPFYPQESDGSDIYAYIWARTLPCQNLNGCSAVIPLINQFWLSKKENKKVALLPDEKDGQIVFRIVGTEYEPIPDNFDPEEGTITNGVVTCPLCKTAIPSEEKTLLFQNGKADESLLVVVTKHPDITGKNYRLARDADKMIFNQAQEQLCKKRELLKEKGGLDPVPDEQTPKIKGPGAERAISIHNYNLNTFGALFNTRQQLALVTLVGEIRKTYSDMIIQGYTTDYSRAVSAYLGLWLSRVTELSSNLCRWKSGSESSVEVFGMQTLPMIWDYGEANPIRIGMNRLKTILKPLEHLCSMESEPVTVKQASAMDLGEHYPDESFDAVLTDPPYYDNVPYSYLSDFFYVWLKRSVGELYPELFTEHLTRKNNEIVAYGHQKGGFGAGKQFFEEGLSKAFSEIYRILKPNGIAVIVYAHKSTEGWETLINALLDSALVITGAWPIETEKGDRLRAINSAVLASSIYMVARKREQEAFGLYQDVKKELEDHLKQKLFTLWESGFSGADLFIAAIGSGIEVFGKYKQVIDNDDTDIRADRMIADIREILERFDGEQAGMAGTRLTRFYLRWRRQHGEKPVIFNDAHELALSLGIELTEEWGEKSFIRKERTNVRVLGPQEREQTDLSNSEELIDILHHTLVLWRSGNRPEMIQVLSKDSVGSNELIWNVAQQISATLPANSQEHQWLEGWLADQDTIQREVARILENPQQETLL